MRKEAAAREGVASLRLTGKPLTRGLARRIFKLFRPYRGRLVVVLVLIVISAALGMISPFLLRDVLDHAIPENRDELLFALVAGMIGISVATGVLGVGQTWLTNVVGQRVMHDLRTQVYQHLQRLSLAFFTRTRTGEIQSRIANDIGGVQSVVTSTAASIVGNVTTVIASVVAMFLLDWRLALFSLALLPFFVLLARRVGNQRRKITTRQAGRDGRHLLADPGVAQRLRDPARQDDGPRRGAGVALRARVREPGRPRGPLADGRPLDDGRDPDVVRGHAGARLPVRRPGPGRGLDRHDRRLHHAADAALLPGPVAAQRSASTSRPRPRCSTASSSTSTWRSTSSPARDTLGDVRGEVHFDGVWFRYGDEWTLRDIDVTVAPGTRTALVGETGAGKTSLGYLAARLYDPERGAVRIDGTDLRELTFDVAGRRRRRRLPGDLPLPRVGAREPALRPSGGDRRRDRGRRARGADPRARSRRCRTATRPSSASAASASPAARSSASRSPARSCATRPCSCSTRPPARSTSPPSAPSAWRSSASRGPHHARHRPPPLHGPRRRPDRRARPRRGGRARHPRGAARARRPLRRPRRPRRRLPKGHLRGLTLQFR